MSRSVARVCEDRRRGWTKDEWVLRTKHRPIGMCWKGTKRWCRCNAVVKLAEKASSRLVLIWNSCKKLKTIDKKSITKLQHQTPNWAFKTDKANLKKIYERLAFAVYSKKHWTGVRSVWRRVSNQFADEMTNQLKRLILQFDLIQVFLKGWQCEKLFEWECWPIRLAATQTCLWSLWEGQTAQSKMTGSLHVANQPN